VCCVFECSQIAVSFELSDAAIDVKLNQVQAAELGTGTSHAAITGALTIAA
jgi:hypothetical protein